MLFRHFYDKDLAQGSYMIGCQATGEALVVDPRRDIQVYLDEAKANTMTIIAVTETHIHADYLSGSRELASATGAALYLSAEGPTDWQYGFEHKDFHHGDSFNIGNIVIKALHTPGHTPEHMSFLVTDGGFTDEAGYLLSGDFVFVGDLGRPDLLDEAAGGTDTRFEGAKQMFDSLRDVFLPLPDYIQVWPGHGAGSACGKALGDVASTTVGYEKLFSWWGSYVQKGDFEGFSKILLEGQPDAPTYFGRMKRWNKEGPDILGERSALKAYSSDDIRARINKDIIFVDTRPREKYLEGAVPGSLHIPAGDKMATYASYVIDPEKDDRPIVILAADEEQAAKMRDKFSYTGIDNVVGFISSLKGLDLEPVPMISIDDFKKLDNPFVLDVRTANEYNEGHIANPTQIHTGRVMWELDNLPKDEPIISYCRSGARVAVANSALRAAGYDVIELDGSWQGWQAQEKAVVT